MPEKNKAAQEMGRRSWASMDKKQRKEKIKKMTQASVEARKSMSHSDTSTTT